MDFDYGPEAEEFRKEVRKFLDEHLDPDWREKHLADVDVDLDDPAQQIDHPFLREWDRILYDNGFNGIAWPKEYGGRGLSTLEQVVFAEEMYAAGAPRRLNFFGDTLVGPTIIQWGTEEQKQRFLPKILSSEELWCQGFSEPNAGSDLAGLTTTAVRDGDEWVITGQKVWTTLAHTADWIFLLARTDPDAPKHAGISYLLVPMNQDGIEIRPIKQLTGTSEFNELFFDGARTKVDNVVGGVNNGWKVAMTTLGFERGSSATTHYLRFREELDGFIARARSATGPDGRPKTDDPVVRQELAQAFIRVHIMKAEGYRMLTSVLEGDPNAPGASINKMYWSEYHRWAANTNIDTRGPEALLVGDGYRLDKQQLAFLFSRSETIWGGTAEIQRNIVGEKILGLPKEPKPEKTSA